ncbi:MAG: PHP domain-containing protein [Candidatus Omnitrophica bacterium]|nr:PHP domain-containing protein [Candidatus Omnitrophota bacterium]MDD5770681.1 PHP domain-containing protein [Candidatus Omnitrophota bacterium]
MTKYADLHVHTSESDGTLSPRQLVTAAHSSGLSAIAITDHDTVEGIPEALEASSSFGLEIIPGIELTAQYERQEVHILGYFFDFRNAELTEKLKVMQQNRVERVYKIVKNLEDLDVRIDPRDVFDISGKGTVGRMHIAKALVKRGWVSTTGEAFSRYIGDKSPAYVLGFNLSPQEAIKLIRRSGGVAVLAHPYLLRNDELIRDLADCGLGGIEAYYPEHSQSMVNFYLDLAKELKLLVTGGSDFHGSVKPNIKLGMVKIPMDMVDDLRQVRI